MQESLVTGLGHEMKGAEGERERRQINLSRERQMEIVIQSKNEVQALLHSDGMKRKVRRDYIFLIQQTRNSQSSNLTNHLEILFLGSGDKK